MLSLKYGARAASLHLAFGGTVLLLLGCWVFLVWYPYPYNEVLKVGPIFVVLSSVDLLIGPLTTLFLVRPGKSKKEIRLDLCLVIFAQSAALLCGVWTLANARPVYVVFEVDRMKIVLASEIATEDLSTAPDVYKTLPLGRPQLIGVRDPKNGDEYLYSVELSMAGKEPSVRPDWWMPYSGVIDKMKAKALPIPALEQNRPEAKEVLAHALRKSGLPRDQIVWLPLTSSRGLDWVALINIETGEIVGAAPLDGFI